MAFEGALQYVPGVSASADMSAKQFYIMKISGANTFTVCAAITDKILGVLQDNPASGIRGLVAFSGVTKVSASAAISAGAIVGTTSGGQAVTIVPGTDTTQYILGQALNAAANAGDVISVFLMIGGRAA